MSVFDNPKFFPDFYDRIVWPRVSHGVPAPYAEIPFIVDGEKKYLNIKQQQWNYNSSETLLRFSIFKMFGFDATYGTAAITPLDMAFGGTAKLITDRFKASHLTLSHRTTVEEAEHYLMLAFLTFDNKSIEKTL